LKLFQASLTFAAEEGCNPKEHGKGRLLALPEKNFPRTNTLAYFASAPVTKKKSFKRWQRKPRHRLIPVGH
jgi:hypothetical protein